MRGQRNSHSPKSTVASELNSRVTRPEGRGTEDIQVRNYDTQWGYDLSLEVVDEDGSVIFEQWYYLQPGQLESEIDVLPPGEYDVRVTLDNLKEESIRCQLDADPENTLLIEVGNGALSLTAGLTD